LEGALAPLPPDVPRHQRWLAFLRLIEREVPGHLQLHLVVDGAVTYGHAEVRAWLSRHPRMLLHMPATDAAWPKRIKRILHGLAEHPIGRGSFTSLPALVQAVAHH